MEPIITLSKFKNGEFWAQHVGKDRDFSDMLFRKWAGRDLEGAIASLSEAGGIRQLQSLKGHLRPLLREELIKAQIAKRPEDFGMQGDAPDLQKFIDAAAADDE